MQRCSVARTFHMTQWKRWVFTFQSQLSRCPSWRHCPAVSSKWSVQRQRKHGWQKLFEFEERPASVCGLTAVVEGERVVWALTEGMLLVLTVTVESVLQLKNLFDELTSFLLILFAVVTSTIHISNTQHRLRHETWNWKGSTGTVPHTNGVTTQPMTDNWFPASRFRSSVTVSPCSVAIVRKNYIHPKESRSLRKK